MAQIRLEGEGEPNASDRVSSPYVDMIDDMAGVVSPDRSIEERVPSERIEEE